MEKYEKNKSTLIHCPRYREKASNVYTYNIGVIGATDRS